MDKILKLIKKVIPKPIFRFIQPYYHFFMAFTGNIVYRFPGYKMTVIGVTGTNGKSTTADILCGVLKASGEKVGMISTVSIEIAGRRIDNVTDRTTLGRWKTHKLLRQMANAGCKYAVVEVASEGIAWYRIWGIPFDAAIFTNLTPEHLNYHKTMENYKNTKGKLFKKLKSSYNWKKTKRVSVVNADDTDANYFFGFKADEKYAYEIPSRTARAKRKGCECSHVVKAMNIVLSSDGTDYDISTENHNYHVRTGALGKFNVYNELAAFCVGWGYGIDPEKMVKVLAEFKGTKGRAEKIEKGQNFDLIIDYAVTPDAQEALYSSLKKISKGKLISVFGATGDRDRAKRPEMGKVAAELTDVVIITDDETYTEDSKKIIEEVYAGVPESLKSQVKKIPDRLDAIKEAMSLAKKGDTVVVTGIGHQKSRNMGGKKITWDERQILAGLLKERKSAKK